MDLNAYQLALIKTASESSHIDFSRIFFKFLESSRFRLNWHHKLICDVLELTYSQLITRLIVNCPPGFTKTLLAVIFYIARGLIVNPRARFIHLSYSDELALDNSRKIKEIVKSDLYQALWPAGLQQDVYAKKLWYTEQGGGLKASATGGQVTGFRAGLMGRGFSGAVVVDDPNKPEEVYSDSKRERVNRSFVDTVKTRLMVRSTPIIVIMQRLHDSDLSGFLLRGGSGDKWHHLIIPGEYRDQNQIYDSTYTHGIPISYMADPGPTWIEKYSQDTLDEYKFAAPDVYSAQFDQNPGTGTCGIFNIDWFRYYEQYDLVNNIVTLDNGKRVSLIYKMIYADTAMKKEERNDWSVLQLWGLGSDDRIYILDQIRGKWESPELRQYTIDFIKRHKFQSGVNNLGVRSCKIEDKASGTGLIQELRRRSDLIPIEGIQRDRDKISRARSVAPQIKLGKVVIPLYVDWVGEYRFEFSRFRADMGHRFDDQIDATMDAIEDMLIGSSYINYAKVI